ncbi:MAG: VanZ family protein [Clostridia bacterium]|nr:VanZ family protein [Clostridia bacterium]
MKRTIALILSWALAAGCAVCIFLFSAQTGAQSADVSSEVMGPFARILTFLFGDQGHNVFRKFAHFFIFAALMFFVYHALYRTRRNRRLSAVLPFAVCVLYAVGDEVHQLFVPERACRLFDVGVDALGCAVGGLCFYLLAKICLYISQKHKKKECNP